MKATAAHTRDYDGSQSERITGSATEQKESECVHGQADSKELLAADPIGEDSHRVARQEVRKHQQRHQEGGRTYGAQAERFLNRQVERHQRNLIDVSEGMQDPDEDE